MHATARNLRGGVSPRNTRLRGQSITEYVLIAAVIGLVIVFAGPQVFGAIRNQFNQIANTVDSGTEGDNFMSAEEKAMKTVANKETKDWTLDEQQAAATDIAKNGTSSVVYAKAKVAMDAGTKFTMKLRNGKTLEYRIIGINHDDLADGSGKAGLTFLTTNNVVGEHRMNVSNTTVGGWEKSELRQKMNSGEIWNLMPSDFQSKVKAVTKLTNNVSGTYKNAAVTITSDKLFLLSYSEIVETPYSEWSKFPWIGNEGTQYEAFKCKVTNNYGENLVVGNGSRWWERTIHPAGTVDFLVVYENGDPASGDGYVLSANYACPAWCF